MSKGRCKFQNFIKNCSWAVHENNISSALMQELFDLKVTPYSLRNNNLLKLPTTNILRYGTQALFFKRSIIWNIVPYRYKI